MQLYDLSIIINPRVSDVELPAALEVIRKELQEMGVRELQEETIGKKKLGYPIQGNHFGHIIYFRFQNDEKNVNALKEKLILQPEIIRSMLSVVRHDLPFKPEHKLPRFNNARAQRDDTRSTQSSITAPIIETPVAEKITQEIVTPTAKPIAEKVDLAELDKRIDDILSKETF